MLQLLDHSAIITRYIIFTEVKSLAVKKNEEIRIKIESISSQGSGVGHFDSQAIFVANTAVGDDIVAHIIKAKQNYAVGIISKIIKPSKDRIPVDCEAFSRCGGCAYRHISYKSELEGKYQRVKDALNRIGHIDITPNEIIGADECNRYRNKAQYPIGLSPKGDLVIGFYSPHSHRICDCTDCQLQPEVFRDIIGCIKKWILTTECTVYNEKNGRGLLRHIYLRRASVTGEIMVCLVINGKSVPNETKLVSSLISENHNIKSVVLNVNQKDTNVVLGDECINLYGDGYITDVLCSKKIRISPLSFYQVNHDQAEKLYGKAREYAQLNKDDVLLDLYCGAGTIGLSMVDDVKELIGVEVIPEAIDDAKFNAGLNGVTNARFICDDAKGTAKKLFDEGIAPDVVIIDPPRKGCDIQVLETIAQMAPERVVYVSCDPATLARDCERFAQLGYEVKEVTPVDLFPRTTHVECVALLNKTEE